MLDDLYQKARVYETSITPVSLSSLKPLDNKDGGKDLEKLLEYVRHWMSEPYPWIFIQGGTGVGKTHILKSIKVKLPWITTYISSAKLQSELFSSLRKDSDNTVQDIIKVLSAVPILLLDDFGLEHAGDFTLDSIAAIIDNRYEKREYLSTVVTTNLDIGDLLSSPDPAIRRIASRVSDLAIAKVFQLRQEDYRSLAVTDSRRVAQ